MEAASEDYTIYGFTMPESVLINWGYSVALAQRIRPSAVPSVNVRAAMEDIRKKAEGLHTRLVLAYYVHDLTSTVECDYAIALASNDVTDGLPNAPPPAETIDKIRAILRIKPGIAPAWYYADRTAEDIPRRI